MFEETSQLGLKNKYKFVPKGNKKSQIKKHSSKIPDVSMFIKYKVLFHIFFCCIKYK